jgi:hypothetical protein
MAGQFTRTSHFGGNINLSGIVLTLPKTARGILLNLSPVLCYIVKIMEPVPKCHILEQAA